MSRNADDLVPEGFDLDRARAAPSSTPDEHLTRCPDCTSTRISAKSGRWESMQARPETWWCRECGAHFDTPVEGSE